MDTLCHSTGIIDLNEMSFFLFLTFSSELKGKALECFHSNLRVLRILLTERHPNIFANIHFNHNSFWALPLATVLS